MYGRRTFTKKFGDPKSFIFKGQVWDSRLADASSSDKDCAICKRHVRFVFVLKQVQTTDPAHNPEIGKLEIGRCCFHHFRKWHRDLFRQLFYALQYELNREIAVRQDKQRFGKWAKAKAKNSV